MLLSICLRLRVSDTVFGRAVIAAQESTHSPGGDEPVGHFVLVGRGGQPGLYRKAIRGLLLIDAVADVSFQTILRLRIIKMTTSNNVNWQTSNLQYNNGVTALEVLREAQDIEYSSLEESYELLPSGD